MSQYQLVSDNHHYHVVNSDGERVSGFYTNRFSAEMRMDRLERDAAACTRPCITCGKRFKSEGKHNRMCDACRARADPTGLYLV